MEFITTVNDRDNDNEHEAIAEFYWDDDGAGAIIEYVKVNGEEITDEELKKDFFSSYQDIAEEIEEKEEESRKP